MSNYLKPQSPLQIGSDFIYPITTTDQILTDDGSRLNAKYITTILNEEDAGVIPKTNANQLGGIDADQYALKSEVNDLINNFDFSAAQPANWDGNTLATQLPNGLTYAQGGIDAGFPSNYITCFAVKYNNDRCMQIAMIKGNATTYVRAPLSNSADGWTEWKRVITANDTINQAVNSNKLGGIEAEQYATKAYVSTEIATNAGGAQGNWEQNDSSAKDYIQNRTHWKEEMEPVTFTQDLTIKVYYHDSEWGFNGSGGILYRGDWSETEFTPLVDFTPKSGQIMTVQIGTDIYSGELIQEDDNTWRIGDPNLCRWGENFSDINIPVTHNYYFGINDMRVFGWDTWQFYAYFDPSVGYGGESYPVTITISGTEYHPLEEGYIPKKAFILPAYNLFDNSNFTNPVNQRGQTSYTGGFGIDRWQNTNSTITLTDNGLKLTKTDTSNVSKFVGTILPENININSAYTVAISINGTIEIFNSMFPNVNGESYVISGNTINCEFGKAASCYVIRFVFESQGEYMMEWAALYEGEYIAELLPPYVPKGYTAELLECQRYYYQFQNGTSVYGYTGSSGTSVYIAFELPTTMRLTNPTVSMSGNIYGAFGGAGTTSLTSISSSKTMGKQFELVMSLPSSLSTNTVYAGWVNGTITVSADL